MPQRRIYSRLTHYIYICPKIVNVVFCLLFLVIQEWLSIEAPPHHTTPLCITFIIFFLFLVYYYFLSPYAMQCVPPLLAGWLAQNNASPVTPFSKLFLCLSPQNPHVHQHFFPLKQEKQKKSEGLGHYRVSHYNLYLLLGHCAL